MDLSELETIPVKQLQLGMMVHGIAEQAGKLAVKKKGKVSHLSLIDQLSAHGVVSVIVEKAPNKNINVLQKLNQQKKRIQANKKINNEAEKEQETTEISLELEVASRLIKKSYDIHKTFAENVKNSVHLDITKVNHMALDIYDSLSRNPSALLSLSMLMNSNDYLANHSIHVAILMCFFAKHMGMSQKDCERLTVLGYLFDIGMVKIPQHIVNKKTELTVEEEMLMQEHVNYSLDLVAPLHLDNDLRLAIEQHHERLVGKSYPNGYSSSKIHKFSRMLAIVDCYDSLISDQIHQVAQTPTSALKHLRNPENGYDPKLVLRFIRAIGIYPIGSLVVLSNKRIGLVIKTNFPQTSSPVVRVFYSISASAHVREQTVNLAAPHNDLKIIKVVLAEQYGLHVDKNLMVS